MKQITIHCDIETCKQEIRIPYYFTTPMIRPKIELCKEHAEELHTTIKAKLDEMGWDNPSEKNGLLKAQKLLDNKVNKITDGNN